MKDYGCVSVIVSMYNSSEFIGATIESVLAQTYENWEILVTDDCSTDNSVEIVRSYMEKEPRIKLFLLERNSGAGVARNTSIEHAQGRYIAILDSDDRWMKDKLAKELSLMEEKNCKVSYGSMLMCNEEGTKIVGIELCRPRETFRSTVRQCRFPALTFIYDADALGKMYMPELRKRQDWCYEMQVMKKAGVAYGVSEPIAIYRMRSHSLSSRKTNLIKYNIEAYKQSLGWSTFHSWVYFLLVFMPHYLIKVLRRHVVNMLFVRRQRLSEKSLQTPE